MIAAVDAEGHPIGEVERMELDQQLVPTIEHLHVIALLEADHVHVFECAIGVQARHKVVSGIWPVGPQMEPGVVMPDVVARRAVVVYIGVAVGDRALPGERGRHTREQQRAARGDRCEKSVCSCLLHAPGAARVAIRLLNLWLVNGSARQARGTNGRTTCEACSASCTIVCCAVRSSASLPSGLPVLGLRSHLGKQLEVTCRRMRWPALNTLLVAHRSIVCSYGRFGSSRSARMMPSVRLYACPSGKTSTSRATKSVAGAVVHAHSLTSTGPVTSVSSRSTSVVNVSTSGRASISRWSSGPGGNSGVSNVAPPSVGTGLAGS